MQDRGGAQDALLRDGRHCVPARRYPGNELAFADGVHSGAGQLAHWLFLQVLHRSPVHGWLIEHQVDLGSSEASATHALVVDADSGAAHMGWRRSRSPAASSALNRWVRTAAMTSIPPPEAW